jgi:hypothetical protein
MKGQENEGVTAANQRRSVCGELQCVNPNTIKPKQAMKVRWLRLLDEDSHPFKRGLTNLETF